MNKKAYVMNRSRAVNVPADPCGCHILFQTPMDIYRDGDGLPFQGWHESIVIQAHDITAPTLGCVHFDSGMASELVSFLLKNDGRLMLVSCDAGQSRSVAVGAILRDYFGYDVTFVCSRDDEFRNILIYTTLAREMRALWERQK